MYALILCAGLGTRLHPITTKYAKPAIQVIDRPLLEWSIDRLVQSGIQNIVITTFHNAESITSLNLSAHFNKCSIRILQEKKLLGTGGGIRNALLAYGLDDIVIVVNGDTLWDLDLRYSIENHIVNHDLLTLLLLPRRDGYTPIYLDDNNKVLHIGQLAGRKQSYTHSGISILSKESQEQILLDNKPNFVDDFIISQVKSQNVCGELVDGFWADLGTLERYLSETIRFARYKKIYHDYVVGKGCTVNQSAEVSDSILWNNITIGPRACVKHSIVLNDVRIPENSIIINKLVMPTVDKESVHPKYFDYFQIPISKTYNNRV